MQPLVYSSREVVRQVARVVGQMAISMEKGRTGRELIRGWATTLRQAAENLERMANDADSGRHRDNRTGPK